MGLTLPPELLHPILGYILFPFDFESVQSCSLVSKTWCSAARPYLFRLMCFTSSDEDCKERIRRFRSSPYLLTYITDIILEQQPPADDPWKLDDAKELGRLLSGVQNLSIKNWSSPAFSRQIWTAIMNGIFTFVNEIGGDHNNLNKISIRTVICATPEELFQILSKVQRRPRELRLDLVGHFVNGFQSRASQGEYPVSLTPITPEWPLRALTLNTTELRQDVCRWLLSKAVDLSDLQKLTLVRRFSGTPNDQPVALELLRAIGSSLRELKLVCRWNKPPMTHSHEILNHLPVLEKLIIGCDSSGGSSLGIMGGLTVCTDIIRPLQQHESLQEIVLMVDISMATRAYIQGSIRTPTDPSPEWELLDTRLANHAHFPKLTRFYFGAAIKWIHLKSPNNPWTSATPLCHELQARVCSVLPQLDAKQALIVNAEEITCYSGWRERIPESQKYPYMFVSFDDDHGRRRGHPNAREFWSVV